MSSSSSPRGTLIAAALGFVVVLLDVSAVNVALGALHRDFATAVAGLQWLLHQGLQPSHPPYLSPQFPWGRYVLGGLLFGSGMVLARGCPLRTLVLSAQGSVPALLSLGAMSVAAFAMTSGFVFNDWIAPWILRLNLDLGRWGWQSQGLDALLGLHGGQARALL
ncbi:YeeE/YedE thiosulfate transporter family protein, partial [Thiomonas sp. SCN 64-16]|uniref:YeeE/YedE thiosulfate transporter family protein n=1 Tax=Thiomonas sp. SCN 64-16 TaxID=1660151 RepID=UPI00257B27B8